MLVKPFKHISYERRHPGFVNDFLTAQLGGQICKVRAQVPPHMFEPGCNEKVIVIVYYLAHFIWKFKLESVFSIAGVSHLFTLKLLFAETQVVFQLLLYQIHFLKDLINFIIHAFHWPRHEPVILHFFPLYALLERFEVGREIMEKAVLLFELELHFGIIHFRAIILFDFEVCRAYYIFESANIFKSLAFKVILTVFKETYFDVKQEIETLKSFPKFCEPQVPN